MTLIYGFLVRSSHRAACDTSWDYAFLAFATPFRTDVVIHDFYRHLGFYKSVEMR